MYVSQINDELKKLFSLVEGHELLNVHLSWAFDYELLLLIDHCFEKISTYYIVINY